MNPRPREKKKKKRGFTNLAMGLYNWKLKNGLAGSQPNQDIIILNYFLFQISGLLKYSPSGGSPRPHKSFSKQSYLIFFPFYFFGNRIIFLCLVDLMRWRPNAKRGLMLSKLLNAHKIISPNTVQVAYCVKASPTASLRALGPYHLSPEKNPGTHY